jgi:hypothetical protein
MAYDCIIVISCFLRRQSRVIATGSTSTSNYLCVYAVALITNAWMKQNQSDCVNNP